MALTAHKALSCREHHVNMVDTMYRDVYYTSKLSFFEATIMKNGVVNVCDNFFRCVDVLSAHNVELLSYHYLMTTFYFRKRLVGLKYFKTNYFIISKILSAFRITSNLMCSKITTNKQPHANI